LWQNPHPKERPLLRNQNDISKFVGFKIPGRPYCWISHCLRCRIAVKACRPRNTPLPKPAALLKQGFDFRAFRSESWKGPAIGEKIDLKMLKAADGTGITPLLGKQPIMLASINPTCGMCKVAREEMLVVREGVVAEGVQYFAVCFNPTGPAQDFFEYAKALKFPEPALKWEGEVPPQGSVLDMTVPPHLLLNQEGIVLQVWPGSSTEKDIRQRMASQIINDTLIVNEVLRAGSSSSTKDSKAPAKPTIERTIVNA
jgi:hypothetical protein